MAGVVFLKFLYLHRQKKCHQNDFHEHELFYNLCVNEIQLFKDRFYCTFQPYISLNRNDTPKAFSRTWSHCLVLEKHNQEALDLVDVQSHLTSYGSMEYDFRYPFHRIYLFVQSEQCQRRILKDYLHHSLFHVETFTWWKHAIWMQYVRRISVLAMGLGILFLVKRRMSFPLARRLWFDLLREKESPTDLIWTSLVGTKWRHITEWLVLRVRWPTSDILLSLFSPPYFSIIGIHPLFFSPRALRTIVYPIIEHAKRERETSETVIHALTHDVQQCIDVYRFVVKRFDLISPVTIHPMLCFSILNQRS